MGNVQVSRAPARRVGQQVLVAIGVVAIVVAAIVVTTHDDAVGLMVVGVEWRLKKWRDKEGVCVIRKQKGGRRYRGAVQLKE